MTLAERVLVLTHRNVGYADHPLQAAFPAEAAPVRFEGGCFVGARATILAGVTIGREAFVAAGSVVTDDVPPRTLVGGVPARRDSPPMRMMDGRRASRLASPPRWARSLAAPPVRSAAFSPGTLLLPRPRRSTSSPCASSCSTGLAPGRAPLLEPLHPRRRAPRPASPRLSARTSCRPLAHRGRAFLFCSRSTSPWPRSAPSPSRAISGMGGGRGGGRSRVRPRRLRPVHASTSTSTRRPWPGRLSSSRAWSAAGNAAGSGSPPLRWPWPSRPPASRSWPRPLGVGLLLAWRPRYRGAVARLGLALVLGWPVRRRCVLPVSALVADSARGPRLPDRRSCWPTRSTPSPCCRRGGRPLRRPGAIHRHLLGPELLSPGASRTS